MLIYHLVYDIPDPAVHPTQYRVLVAYKNVYGTRFDGRPSAPSVLKGAGQLVIPGGDPDTTRNDVIKERDRDTTRNDVIEGGQKEFFEETGIDFGDAAVRADMRCETPPWSALLHWDRNKSRISYCVYQRVKNAEAVSEACNENIRSEDPDCQPSDQELYRTTIRDASNVSDVCRYFGPIPEIALENGWRGEQFNKLDIRQKDQAREKSLWDPGDWFVTAVELLLRSDS
jgi:hypothetical protein